MRTGTISLCVVLSIAAAPRPAAAWGFEAHKYIMGRVIPLLPPEVRPFFEKYRTTIVEHVVDPDLWRTAGWEAEPVRHYLDMDAYGPYPFRKLPRDYDEAVKRYGRQFVDKNGLLPWRTAEIHGKLVEAFTQKSAYARENIKFFSSVLTHYVSDGHVPFHAALNYDGQLTGQWGIHSRFESELFERYQPALRVNPEPVGKVAAPRDFMFETLIASFALTAPVLAADKQAASGRELYDDEYFAVFFRNVQPMLEKRLAASISAAASLITAAWIDAGRPALPVDEQRQVRTIRRQ